MGIWLDDEMKNVEIEMANRLGLYLNLNLFIQ